MNICEAVALFLWYQYYTGWFCLPRTISFYQSETSGSFNLFLPWESSVDTGVHESTFIFFGVDLGS